MVQGTGSLLTGEPCPLFKAALLRFVGFNAGLMAKQPEKDEVGIDFPFHHAFEVEFDVRLTGEADVISEDTQAKAVGDEAPEVVT